MALLLAARRVPVMASLLRANECACSCMSTDAKPSPPAETTSGQEASTRASVPQGSVSAPSEEEWTEVVHSSGGVYYWNQKTGEERPWQL